MKSFCGVLTPVVMMFFSPKAIAQGLHNKSISLTLEFPKSISKNIVSTENTDSTCDIRLVIKNNTDTAASFYEDWNTWGFYNIGFQIITADTTFHLTRTGGCWDKNFPSSVMLFPGDSFAVSYNVSNCRNNRCDCFSSLPKQSLEGIKIKAVYQLEAENHRLNIENVLKYGESTLIMYSSHPKKFKRMTLKDKINSYVTEKLYSKDYTADFVTSN